MSFCVCGGAMLTCSFGMAPSVLNVLPVARVVSNTPLATIMDNVPLVNVMPFGLCQNPANPAVAAATAAAMGVLTPMPCIPVIPGPWIPGSPTVLIGGKPALNNTCKLMCAYGGVIQITNPATTNIQVP
jgi:hypothetical protein